MSTNGIHRTPVLDLPPGLPGQAYTLPSLSGEIIYIPCSKSATRLLVTGKETSNAFAVVGSGGTQSPPIGFHYHNDAHDVFLCIKGQVNVWAGDQARTMNSGDFASVPPGTIHQYQILGTHTEFLGLIVPGGWEEFFRFIGEPYSGGPLFPLTDDRNPFEVLIPKLKAAAEQFDMIPCPRHPSFDPQPWLDTDTSLPGKPAPYFLRNNTGPAHITGNTIIRPLASPLESNNRFSVASIEGSSHTTHAEGTIFPSSSPGVKFASIHHCFQVSDGSVTFSVDGATSTLHVGETIYIPAGTGFKFDWASRLAKVYAFSNGAGIADVLVHLGTSYDQVLLPEKALGNSAAGRLVEVGERFGFEVL